MGRVSRGVRGIRLRAGDQVIGMDIVEDDSYIFVISEFGYGKRTRVNQFTAHKRGGVGIRSAVVNKKTGQLIAVKTLVGKDQEVIIISTAGQTIRLGLKNIPALGRATQGVRIMRLNAGDSVASLALVEKVEDIEEDEKGSEKAAPAKKPIKKAPASPTKVSAKLSAGKPKPKITVKPKLKK